jgi:DUF1680 family protein
MPLTIPDFPIRFPAFGQVTLGGRLAERYAGNQRYLSEIYRQRRDWMLEPFQHRDRPWVLPPLRNGKSELNWAGEYAGKWLDAACLAGASAAAGASPLAAQAQAFAPALAATQEADGYLGIELPPRRANCDWDLWNLKYSLTGLLTHYEVYGDPASLSAARRGGEWLISRFAPITSPASAFYRSPSEGGVSVDIIDQLVRLYHAAGDPRLLDFVGAIVAHFPPLAAMRASGQAVLTHAYMLSSYLGGLVEWAAAAGRLGAELPWVERVWDDLAARHLYPTGSLGFREHLRETAPNDTPVSGGQPDRHHQETCATVEWLLFNARLYQATGRARYAQALEHSIYNALLAAQSTDGQRWLYYLPLRYEKTWFSGPTSCCYWSGPRGIARLPQWVYALDAEGLRVNLYEASTAQLELAGQPVRVAQTTRYPDSGQAAFAITPAEPLRFTLRLRRPHFASAVTVALNGQPLPIAVDADGYLALDRTWAPGDRITLDFDLRARVQRFLADDYGVLLHGPEVLAIDQRDNPGLDLDQIVLDPLPAVRPMAPLAGRRCYAGEARVSGQRASVVFTPYADCGGDGARFRTAFPLA